MAPRTRARKTEEKGKTIEEVPPAAAGDVGDGERDPVEAFTEAYAQAIEARDPVTGVIPAVAEDAVRVAYGQVPKRKRAGLVAKLAGEVGRNGATADGQVDTSLAVAVMLLGGLFARLNDEERPAPPPHDPVPPLAGILAALAQVRDEVMESLSDEDRERVALAETTSDPAAVAASEATLAAVRKQVERARNGRSRAASGPRTSVQETTERIQKAIADAHGPLSLSALSEKSGVSAATLWSRWQANNTPGVEPVEENGVKAFRAAA